MNFFNVVSHSIAKFNTFWGKGQRNEQETFHSRDKSEWVVPLWREAGLCVLVREDGLEATSQG